MPRELQRAFLCDVAAVHRGAAQQPAHVSAGAAYQARPGNRRCVGVTFAPDGRATFAYGGEITPGEPHVIWRRVGSHQVLSDT